MTYMFSIHGENDLCDRMWCEIEDKGGYPIAPSRCCCTYLEFPVDISNARRLMHEVDVLVYHPSRNGRASLCWNKMKTVIDSNPDRDFVIFARWNPDAIDFFGRRKGIRYFADGELSREIAKELLEKAKIPIEQRLGSEERFNALKLLDSKQWD